MRLREIRRRPIVALALIATLCVVSVATAFIVSEINDNPTGERFRNKTIRQLMKDIITPSSGADNDTKPIEHDYDPLGRLERVVIFPHDEAENNNAQDDGDNNPTGQENTDSANDGTGISK
jgi:hypothetical protein